MYIRCCAALSPRPFERESRTGGSGAAFSGNLPSSVCVFPERLFSLTDRTPNPELPQHFRIGIVFCRDSAANHEVDLVGELASSSKCRGVVLVGVSTRPPEGIRFCARRFALRASSVVAAALARTRPIRVPLLSLAGPRVEVVRATTTQLDGTLRDAKLDVVVDLRGVAGVGELARSASWGVLQIWCDGAPEDLEFGSVVDGRPRSRTLTLTLARREWADPRVVLESRQVSIGDIAFRDRQLLARRSIALVLRALRQRHPVEAAPVWHQGQGPDRGILVVLGQAIAACIPAFAAEARRVVRGEDAWFVAYRSTRALSIAAERIDNPEDVALPHEGFRVVENPPGVLRADPFIFRWEGVDHVFLEEYAMASRRGVIAWAALRPDGRLGTPEVVLERPYHLSYPYVFQHGESVYMIPESAANSTVDLYRAVEFPREWELHRTLLSGVNAVDATPHYDGSRWWIFANIGEYGSSTWDELFLYYADVPEGPWRAHPQNPVKSDASSSRPAGALFRHKGLLVRPSQDCSVRYGGGIALCVVDELTTTEFHERVVCRISPDALFQGLEALHTCNSSPTLEVMDGIRRRSGGSRWRTT